MAHESAVADFSELETSTTCAGCGRKLNLLENHVIITAKVQRNVVETVDARLVGAEVDEDGVIVALAEVPEDEDADTNRYYVGTRSGETHHALVHNNECAISYLGKRHSTLDGTPKLKLLREENIERSAE